MKIDIAAAMKGDEAAERRRHIFIRAAHQSPYATVTELYLQQQQQQQEKR